MNGPAIAGRGSQFAIAWLTAAHPSGGAVQLVRSADGGTRLLDPVTVDTGNLPGRVDVALMGEGRSVVSWVAEHEERGELRVRVIDESGRGGPITTVARLSTSRDTGFPRLAAQADRALLAWTDAGGERPAIRAAWIQPAVDGR